MPKPMRVAAAALALALGGSVLSAQDRQPPGKQDKQPPAKPLSDAEFVIKAASGGMFEVESSKLVKDTATGEVKKFAEMMIADHEKANKELMEVAKKANLGVPTKLLDEHQKLLDKVKGAKGKDQERAYMDAQVTAHEEAVMLFESASKTARDAGLKAFAEKTLPTLKEHLEHAKKHHGAGGKDKP